MRFALLLAGLALALAAPAGAAETRLPTQSGAYACAGGAGHMLQRVAARSDTQPRARPQAIPGCCSRQLGCAEFLATTVVEKEKKAPRT